MHDYALVGCGHCGAGVVPRLAQPCPFQEHPLCDACSAAVLRFVAEMQARGHDPLPKPRRRRRARQAQLL